MKKCMHWLSTILLVLIALFALSLFAARLFGGGAYVVLSGSMAPTYQKGDLLYVKRAEAASLKEGDVITFVIADDLVVTHRIAGVVRDGDEISFVTKGDANDAVDAAPVHERNLIGTPAFCIPLLGYLINLIRRPPGLYISLLLALALALYSVFPRKRRDTPAPGANTDRAKKQ